MNFMDWNKGKGLQKGWPKYSYQNQRRMNWSKIIHVSYTVQLIPTRTPFTANNRNWFQITLNQNGICYKNFMEPKIPECNRTLQGTEMMKWKLIGITAAPSPDLSLSLSSCSHMLVFGFLFISSVLGIRLTPQANVSVSSMLTTVSQCWSLYLSISTARTDITFSHSLFRIYKIDSY